MFGQTCFKLERSFKEFDDLSCKGSNKLSVCVFSLFVHSTWLWLTIENSYVCQWLDSSKRVLVTCSWLKCLNQDLSAFRMTFGGDNCAMSDWGDWSACTVDAWVGRRIILVSFLFSSEFKFQGLAIKFESRIEDIEEPTLETSSSHHTLSLVLRRCFSFGLCFSPCCSSAA